MTQQSTLPTTERASSASTLVSVARIAAATLTIVGIAATFFEAAGRTQINPFNFFGYFTLQSNLVLAAAWLVTAAAAIRSATVHPSIVLFRAFTTTYIVIVGLVYATLLAPLGAAGGVPIPWANVVLHIITPTLAIADWVFVRDRSPLPWRLLPLSLIYPLAWMTVVLIRGGTDGWFPYPFLDPARGYGTISVVCLVIGIAILSVAAAVFVVSRLRRSKR